MATDRLFRASDVLSRDEILVSGDRNTITYKKAAKAKKTGVLSSGKNNKVSQVK